MRTTRTEEKLKGQYSAAESAELIRRAEQIRARRESELSGEVLASSAAEVGISAEDLHAAEAQLQAERAAREQRRKTIRLASAVVAAFLALFLIFTYNALNGALGATEAARADLQVALQRRADVATQLVGVVREAAGQERLVLERINRAREGLRSPDLAAQARADAQLREELERLRSAVERNPGVGSTELYRDLQAQIEGSENRVAEYRRRYNRAAAAYNRAARSFPTAVVRPLFRMPGAVPTFEADAAAREVPRL